MTSLVPREPYTADELRSLYPEGLELQLVQVLLRHGERTPVSARFQNTGLHGHWPYCNAARTLTSAVLSTSDFSKWGSLKYQRSLETFGPDDGPVLTAGPKQESDAICLPGELTDLGRKTTLELGHRLRRLYVDQLGFMPKVISNTDMIYLRSTPIPRALESMQQAFSGMYPSSALTADCPPPTIYQRTPANETLYPNDSGCRRFAHLNRAFAERTAARWNGSPEMRYVNKKIGKWMPDGLVAVDSRPRLSGIMDSVNATFAHGAPTKLPAEFYDPKLREILDKVAVEEWFAGYTESREYRMLGIGALAGDIVSRMVGNAEQAAVDASAQGGGDDDDVRAGKERETGIKFALSGCHDTTLAALLTGLGAFKGEKWPPFTSHIAVELFKKTESKVESEAEGSEDAATLAKKPKGFWNKKSAGKLEGIARRPMQELTEDEKQRLEGYFVRLRYNDKVMQVPGCKLPGNHLEGDESFCTLTAFKTLVDKFTPPNWKKACGSNLDSPKFPPEIEPAGEL
ncbi:histidine acid phosphatase-like protein [Eremomyces bilateralis CBS 781.70]|uniref:3-phytase n=1 Tax=Eremomyces bilateralis CBS 781.70 TaxID=1392243 RepID=A0A6G1G0P8_9PEZI|nr:histidine acid phosphatase-like protein [Eremomyces bilateralis CBS 781.70]KAF1811500.1 histidine acid phosphatase-like protein [Eremomyces bilateralis CBS 781.70]